MKALFGTWLIEIICYCKRLIESEVVRIVGKENGC
jgi:hypothetical protein